MAGRGNSTGLNLGSTLRASVGAGGGGGISDRRRSTAGTSRPWAAQMLGPAARAEATAEAESINYENLDDLFREADDESVHMERTNTAALVEARFKALTAQRADAGGSLQPLPTRRQMFGMYLDSSPAGRRWDQVDALLNTLIAAVHIAETTHVRTGHLSVPMWSLLTKAALGGLLLLQFVPRYLLAPDPLEYLRSTFSIITLVTALTPIAAVANICIDPGVRGTFMSAGSWVFLYPVVFWRLQPALLRCLVPIKNVYRMSPMTRNVLRALTTVFTTVLAITVLTHAMVFYQSKDQVVEGFDEAFFFIAVSAITGLSSDIEPDTWFTRGVVLVVMFIGIFWLPPRVAEMLSLWQDRSPWPSHYEAETNQMHVLVIGDLEYTALFEFLREFFCEDHGIRTVNTVVVVMSEKSPGKEVSELLHDPSYVNRVKFVLGSPTSFAQLDRVQAERAQAVFLLSSKAAADAAKEDAAKIMVALAVRRFLRARKRAVPVYAQVLLPETVMHMEFLADHVICIEELRLGLLAKNLLVPGFASLIAILTSSIPDSITSPLVRSAQRKPWLAEYVQSLSHEIYSTNISPFLAGAKFQRAAQVIFQRTGATLFGLLIPADDPTGDPRIAINPVDYTLRGGELGFVITDNALASVQIAYLSEAAAVDVEGETAPLLPDGPDAAAPGGPDARQHIHHHRLPAQAPFGRNVMDTVVVAEDERSLLDDATPEAGATEAAGSPSPSPSASRAAADVAAPARPASRHDHHPAPRDEDLIVLEERDSDDGEAASGILAPELARIDAGEDDDDNDNNDEKSRPNKGGSDRGSGGDESPGEEIRRAPLLFDPTVRKSPSTAAAASASAGAAADGAPKGARPADSGPPDRGVQGRAAPAEPTADGLPGDLAGHVVVCDTSDEFPDNITYLISCIRSAAPSEIS
ncbi:hypothetical protein H4R18_000354, partial [Coemansia javaensis]